MRNILLWDKILTQLHSGAYGPAPSYAQRLTDTLAFGANEFLNADVLGRADRDPFQDLQVSWTELEHNLSLMADDGVITADFGHKEIKNVRLTEEGRKVFAMRDDGQRYSQPIKHIANETNSILARYGFPLFGAAALVALFLTGSR